MTIQPKDMNVFFDALGEGYIRRALVNDEFTGKTKAAAERWLAQRGVNRTRIIAIVGIVVTVVGILTTLVLKFMVHGS